MFRDGTWRRRHDLGDEDCDSTHSPPADQLRGGMKKPAALHRYGDLAPPSAAEEIDGRQEEREERPGGGVN